MKYSTVEHAILESVRVMPGERKIALCVLMIEYMEEGYRLFCEELNRKPVALVSWNQLKRLGVAPTLHTELSKIYTDVERECPDTEEFSSMFTSAALDFCVSILYLIDILRGSAQDAPKHIVQNFLHFLEDYDDEMPIPRTDVNKSTLHIKLGASLVLILGNLAVLPIDAFDNGVRLLQDAIQQ